MFGPVSVDSILLLMLVYEPATTPCTSTESVQLAFAESVPPLTSIMEVPDVAVTVAPVNVPVVQFWASPFGVAINKPVGRVSANPTPVNAVDAFGLANVNVRVLVLPCGIVVGENAFESVGSTGRGQPVIITLSKYKGAVA